MTNATPDLNPVVAAEAGWRQFSGALADGRPVILPVGALEQHGDHLPLGTDTIIAERIAQRAAAQLGAVVLPALPYGAPSRPRSGGGPLFPAPNLALTALMGAVGSIADTVVRAGARTLVVVSWHWENAAVLWDVLAESVDGQSVRCVLFDSPADALPDELVSELFPDGFPGWVSEHAGRLETALMLHLSPSLVGEPPEVEPFVRAAFDVLPTPPDAAPSTGVFYPPGRPAAGLGERCFEAIVSAVVHAVCEVGR
jgi:creatinine amidohydrolase